MMKKTFAILLAAVMLLACIPAMAETLTAAARDDVRQLQRSMIPHDSGCKLAIMPATLVPRQVTGAKVIIFPGPAAREHGGK